jgi:hypothetical protein
MDKKLVEITCKYSDGTSKILDGIELEKWLKFVKALTEKAEIKWYNLGKEKHY